MSGQQRQYFVKTGSNERMNFCYWSIKEPRAILILSHGIGEHIMRYAHMAKYFNDRQIAVLGADRIGDGASTGQRGHSANFDVLLDSIDLLIREAKGHCSELPIFLYGHSMGGNLVLNYMLRRKKDFSGVISSGPWIRLAFEASPFVVLLAKVVGRIFPRFSQSSGLDTRSISRDTMVVNKYEADPLVHSRITAGTGLAMLGAADFLNKYSGAVPVPTLIIHGESDQLTAPKASKEFAERVGGQIEYKLWEQMFHEVHNEPDQIKVFDFVLKWIEKVLASK